MIQMQACSVGQAEFVFLARREKAVLARLLAEVEFVGVPLVDVRLFW